MMYQGKKYRKQRLQSGDLPEISVLLLPVLILLLCLLSAPVSAAAGDAPPLLPAIGETHHGNLMIRCRNMETGDGIAGVRIYHDGGYRGTTTGTDGHLLLTSLPYGAHSVRAVHRGFLENITMVRIPDQQEAVLLLHPSTIIMIGEHGPVEDRIDIVFVPSETEYDCKNQQIITTDYYTANEENFRTDVNNLIRRRFLTLGTMTSPFIGLPDQYQARFNFYYYSDPGDFGDAFNGCAGTLPENFWDEAPFTDVAIIVYPKYGGVYTGPPCEPAGCSSSMGPGIHSWFKSPANSGPVFIHESGHVVFGLIDTYCGDTFYTQNDPYPNVWKNLSACRLDARNNQWDPASCRQIAGPAKKGDTASCTKEFWRSDPEPDIMGTSLVTGRFGNASTLHMRYMIENFNRRLL